MKNYTVYLAELINSQLENRTPAPMPEDLSIAEIIKIANKHHMVRMLVNPLVQLRLGNCDAEFKYVAQAVFVSANQLNEVNRITQKFEQEKIKNQMLKGARLKEYYPRTELREMSDIDLLVLEEDFPRADKALKELGYTFLRKEEHHDIYSKAPGIIIELHRSLYTEKIDKKQFDYFLTFERTSPREGCKYSVDFSKEDFYIYMIAHMARHFYARGCGIRNLVDIYAFREKFKDRLDTKYIESELEKCGIKTFDRIMTELAYIWLQNKECSSFYESLFDYMLQSGIYGKDQNGIWQKYIRYNNLEENVTNKHLKRIYYFPPVVCIEDDYPWVGRHHFLLPAAWLVRGCKALFCKKSKQRLEFVNSKEFEDGKKISKIYKELDMNFTKGSNH